jgi:hypothetical protein
MALAAKLGDLSGFLAVFTTVFAELTLLEDDAITSRMGAFR